LTLRGKGGSARQRKKLESINCIIVSMARKTSKNAATTKKTTNSAAKTKISKPKTSK
jgi:hypothetical protein